MLSFLLLLVAFPGKALATRESSMQLLQHKMVLSGPRELRLEKAEPLDWLHFPKCGSSLINALVHLPGVCPLLGDLTLDEELLGPCWLEVFGLDYCVKLCQEEKFSCPRNTSLPHHPMVNFSAQKGHLVGMFRDPDQRILSGYHDDFNNFAAVDYIDHLEDMISDPDLDMENCTASLRGLPKVPILEFAEGWKGGMTYQLVTEHPTTQTLDPMRPRMTQADAEEAARRVREGFAFVGITEEWDLSMCLLHKMFGGACKASDFENANPSYPGKSAELDYDTSELRGWHDDVDEVVYAAALDVFRQNLIAYNVSHETCSECYRSAGRASSFEESSRKHNLSSL
ncbi:unnamed protein product [Symbiodinium necroappetens]|uniref:Sulfotransferase domain-containing protein n=1 Tax=Symbiodinium necroappetens TaxID=1628268 RepID=A0A813BWE6_9DINO|nr:unnamed protein product [Symbiodinium necroappetens]